MASDLTPPPDPTGPDLRLARIMARGRQLQRRRRLGAAGTALAALGCLLGWHLAAASPPATRVQVVAPAAAVTAPPATSTSVSATTQGQMVGPSPTTITTPPTPATSLPPTTTSAPPTTVDSPLPSTSPPTASPTTSTIPSCDDPPPTTLSTAPQAFACSMPPSSSPPTTGPVPPAPACPPSAIQLDIAVTQPTYRLGQTVEATASAKNISGAACSMDPPQQIPTFTLDPNNSLGRGSGSGTDPMTPGSVATANDTFNITAAGTYAVTVTWGPYGSATTTFTVINP